MSRQVVIILHNAIEATGLQRVIDDTFGIDAHVAQGIDELLQLPADCIDLVVTDSQHFVENLRTFLPRKARTLVLADQPAHGDGDINIVDSLHGTERIVEALSGFLGDKEEEPSANLLSQREIEVLRLVASGMINKQIANTLNISINTVLTHRKNITAKLGIKSVSGLSFYAMMNGIIDPK